MTFESMPSACSCLRIMVCDSCSGFSLRPVRTTEAPALASAMAKAAPIPVPPPVTMAHFPCSEKSCCRNEGLAEDDSDKCRLLEDVVVCLWRACRRKQLRDLASCIMVMNWKREKETERVDTRPRHHQQLAKGASQTEYNENARGA